MTDVAAVDLCKELYELSKWEDCKFYWVGRLQKYKQAKDRVRWFVGYGRIRQSSEAEYWPAYDLGYLIRKLPPSIEHDVTKKECALYFFKASENSYEYGYEKIGIGEYADTPEDAACKLLIELIKQKVITP